MNKLPVMRALELYHNDDPRHCWYCLIKYSGVEIIRNGLSKFHSF